VLESDGRHRPSRRGIQAPAAQPAGRFRHPVAGAGASNLRALRSLAYSERRIVPVRNRHSDELAERYPWIDTARLELQAQRLAQIELGAVWLDAQGGVVRDEEGRIFDVANAVQKWSAAAERWFEQAEAERREQRRHDALAEVMAESWSGRARPATAWPSRPTSPRPGCSSPQLARSSSARPLFAT
jgi:hypothetical protein